MVVRSGVLEQYAIRKNYSNFCSSQMGKRKSIMYSGNAGGVLHRGEWRDGKHLVQRPVEIVTRRL